MGLIFSRTKPKTDFERNLEEIQNFSNALDPIDRRIVNYDDSVVSIGEEATEQIDVSFLDERPVPRGSPIKTIEVQPVHVPEEAYLKGIDNSKFREIELRRVEEDRRRKREEEESRTKSLELKRKIQEIEEKRNRDVVAAAARDHLRFELEGLVLDIPRGKESFKRKLLYY